MQRQWLAPLGRTHSTFVAAEVEPAQRMTIYKNDARGEDMGSIPATNAQFQLAPDDGLAVIALDNWLDARSVPAYPASFVAFDVLYLLLGLEPPRQRRGGQVPRAFHALKRYARSELDPYFKQ